MNFSEFILKLGAEPRNRDPEFLSARQSSPEFENAALEAGLFEDKLERAILISAPDGLLDEIKAIGLRPEPPARRTKWWPMAMAASVLIAVGAVGITWKTSKSWTSVEEYVVSHYRHDGEKFTELADGTSATDIQTVLSELNVEAAPALADIVGLIKYCPTPDGKGVHMILNTQTGPVTVIYMPETDVVDREMLAFDGLEAILVDMKKGSAAIIGPNEQRVTSLYAIVQDSILPLPGSS